MPTKKLLTGRDFCECPPCEERNIAIWPETVIDQVKMNDEGSQTLLEWLTISTSSGVCNSLLEWLETNYSFTPYSLPTASSEVKGGISIDTDYFRMFGTKLSLNSMSLSWTSNPAYSTVLNVGSLSGFFSNEFLTSINIPQPTVGLSINNSGLKSTQLFGGVEQNSITLSIDSIATILGNNTVFNGIFNNRWTLGLDGYKLSLLDSYTGAETNHVTLPISNYTASHGLTIVDTDIQHTNDIDAGSTSIRINNRILSLDTINYDAQGHITGKSQSDINLPAGCLIADLAIPGLLDLDSYNLKNTLDVVMSSISPAYTGGSGGTGTLDGYTTVDGSNTSIGTSSQMLYAIGSNMNQFNEDVIFQLKFYNEASELENPNCPTVQIAIKGQHTTSSPYWNDTTVRAYSNYDVSDKNVMVVFGGSLPEIRIGDFDVVGGSSYSGRNGVKNNAHPIWMDTDYTYLRVEIYERIGIENTWRSKSSGYTDYFSFRWKAFGDINANNIYSSKIFAIPEQGDGEQVTYFLTAQSDDASIAFPSGTYVSIDSNGTTTVNNSQVDIIALDTANHLVNVRAGYPISIVVQRLGYVYYAYIKLMTQL